MIEGRFAMSEMPEMSEELARAGRLESMAESTAFMCRGAITVAGNGKRSPDVMRIISGRFGGRDLGSVPRGVRPTSDRVRESLFSVLGSVAGTRVLDLFAGTGALGLEAFSRGAARVVFVDRARPVVRDLRRRLVRLDLADSEAIEVVALDARKAIRRLAGPERAPFDLVFLDPPYAGGERESTLTALFSSRILSPRARVVVEGPTGHPLAPRPGVCVADERRYGDTMLTWLETANRSRRGEE